MAAQKGVFNKTQALRIHAKKQAHRRYGILLNSEDLRSMVIAIREGGGSFIVRKSHRVSCWKVCFKGYDLVVLYDNVRKAIVTFLPSDCWEVRQSSAALEVPSRVQDGVAL